MQDAVGLFGVGGEAGEEEACLTVAVDHATFPRVGVPTAQFPAQAGETICGMVALTAIEEVMLEEFTVYSSKIFLQNLMYMVWLFTKITHESI